LGDPKYVSVGEARARARALEELARLTRLTDPDAKAGTTFRQAWDSYKARLAKKKRSELTIADYQQIFTAHLEPTFGKVSLQDITRSGVTRLHDRLTAEVADTKKFPNWLRLQVGVIAVVKVVLNSRPADAPTVRGLIVPTFGQSLVMIRQSVARRCHLAEERINRRAALEYRRSNVMGRLDAENPGAPRFGTLPDAIGTLTRLAYAHAKARAIDLTPLLAKANLTLQQIKNVQVRLRVRDQIGFLNLVADALQDDLLGFHLGQLAELREFGFLYYVTASAETFTDALRKLARYSAIANEGVSLTYRDGKNIGISFRYIGVSRHFDRHQIECFMTVLVRICRQLADTRIVPARVRLAHRRGDRLSELMEFFGDGVEFGTPVDEISFAPSARDIAVVSADPFLNKLLISYCEDALGHRSTKRGAFRASVENVIAPILPHGKAKLDEVAGRLGVSERTLARRLASEGLTFSAVLENLRLNLAEHYLSDGGLSISQVAWLLGYQEVSSLTHAVKRWTGKTPRQVRDAKVLQSFNRRRGE
jgi:AraC-like DNA-binding protein